MDTFLDWICCLLVNDLMLYLNDPFPASMAKGLSKEKCAHCFAQVNLQKWNLQATCIVKFHKGFSQ